MDVSELLALVPAEWLEELAVNTNVDHQVKKLNGPLMFRLCLMTMLNHQQCSLRVMEQMLARSVKLKTLHPDPVPPCRHTSISDRLATMNVEYFAQLFDRIFQLFNRQLGEQQELARIDSTCVTFTAKLLHTGLAHKGSAGNLRSIKHTVSLVGSLPADVVMMVEPQFTNENRALGAVLDRQPQERVSVVDRGFNSRQRFDRLTDNKQCFIARHNDKISISERQDRACPAPPSDAELTITADYTGRPNDRNHKLTAHRYRVIRGTRHRDSKTFTFITNLLDRDPYELAALYRRRWDIEVFFKFLKQHLNFKHLVSRHPNGIAVMLYMTMITACLILAYRKLNRIQYPKYAKLQFTLELDALIIQDLIRLCGGDPAKAAHLWPNRSKS